MAITAGKGFGGGAESASISAGMSASSAGVSASTFARAISVAACGFGLAFASGVLQGLIAGVGRSGGGSGDLNVTIAGPAAKGGSINSGGNGTGSDVITGFAAMTGGGASTTRRSGTSIRRSCQGKAKPGSPNS